MNMTDNPLRALERIANIDFECGCKPCTGDCRDTVARANAFDEAQGIAREALAAPAQDSVGEVCDVFACNYSKVVMFNSDLPAGTKLYAGTPPTTSGNAALVAAMEKLRHEMLKMIGTDSMNFYIHERWPEIIDEALAGQAQATQPQAQEACPHTKGYRSDEGERCADCGEIQYPDKQEAGREWPSVDRLAESITQPFVEKAAAMLAAKQPADGGQREWLPNEGAYLVKFDDADREDVLFASTGAKAAALAYYEQVSMSWNAHLFVKIDSNSRDCTTPSAVPPTAANVPSGLGEISAEDARWLSDNPNTDDILDWIRAYGEQCRLAAGRVVVDDAMVERACMAWFNDGETYDSWSAAGKFTKETVRRGMHAALTAALGGREGS